ncbi:MAG: hypothetical protein D3923_12205 [Candidatus Electrothrix sp. AR3]|nr:hypothetical protein [Candidatus Electrothrix sp. AR3]
MGKNWPQTVLGYTALDLKAKPAQLDSIIVVESKDAPLLGALQTLRGFVPPYIHDAATPAVFSAGIGLNMENIAPFLLKEWSAITQKEYRCSLLKDLQEEIKGQNPATMSMATSMLANVRGIAFSLLSLQMDGEAGGALIPQQLDALISLAVKNPALLVQMVSGMLPPPLAALQIPADGTPVPLPLPLPLPFTPQVAIKGSHLVVYTGEKSGEVATELAGIALEASQGLMALNIDYGKYYGLLGDFLSTTIPQEAQNAQAMAIFEAIKNSKVRVQMDLDVTAQGFEIRTDMIAQD